MSDATVDQFVAQFADATERIAFVPSPPAITPSASVPLSGYFAYQQDDGSIWTWDQNLVDWVQIGGGGALSGAALSLLGNATNAPAALADIVAGSDHQVMRRSGTALAFGAVNLAQAAAVTGVLAVANGGTGSASATGVTATSVLTNDKIVRGDGGVRGVQETGITVDDSNGTFGMTRLAVGAGATLEDYTAVYPGSTAYFVGNVQADITDFTNDYVVGFNAAFNLDPAGAVAIPCYAVAGILWTDAADANTFAQLIGLYGEAAHYGSGNAVAVRGIDAWGVHSGSGVVGTVATPNTGACAVFAEGWGVDGGGDALYAQGLYIKSPLCAGGGASITEGDAIRVQDVDVAGITTARLFFYEGTGAFTIDKDSNISHTAAYFQQSEMTAPSAPAANGVRIYAEDNGAGKTRLMALFSSGAAQQIAIQP